VRELQIAARDPLGAAFAADPRAREQVRQPAQPRPRQARDERGERKEESGGEIRHTGSLRAVAGGAWLLA